MASKKATSTMEKEALIDIILNDIKEVHTLVNTFKGKRELNTAFINLTRTKIANINEELTLLEQLNAEKSSTVADDLSLTTQITDSLPAEDKKDIHEPKKQPAHAESITYDTTAEEKPVVEKLPEPEAAPQAKITPREEDVSVSTHVHVEETVADVKVSKQEQKEIKEENPVLEESVPTKEIKNAAKSTNGTSKKTKANSDKSTVLGEVINQETSSVNDVLATKKVVIEDIKQIGKPVNDVKKAFGLNDRFLFQRELFSNNADLFNQTLEQINSMDSFESAASFLQSNYNWDTDDETVTSFYKNVKRRFI